MSTSTIFVIDDQDAVRAALAEMLSVFGFYVETFSSGPAFLDAYKAGARGCLVTDVRMPEMDGIELVRECGRRGIGLPIILISGHADVPMAVEGIKAGAQDFIEKPVDDVQLVAAINRGLERAMARQDEERSKEKLAAQFARLTNRQAEIFDLVSAGFTSHAIAARLDISSRTVESYRAVIMEKMQAESIAVLVRQAVRLGRLAP